MRLCEECRKPIPAWFRADAVCCSATCRKRRERAKVKGLAVTGYEGAGYRAVTDNAALAVPPPRSADPKRLAELIAQIPDDLSIPEFLRR